MLTIKEIHTYYGDSYILQGVSILVDRKEVVSLLGRNGAGKTTVIRSIMGLVVPRKGKIFFRNEDITGKPPYQIARRRIGLVPEDRRIFPNLSVRENLLLGARPQDTIKTSWNLSKIYQHFPVLKARDKNRGFQLSGGEQQMLALARALMLNPELLLLDEPMEGLAPLIIKEFQKTIGEIKNQGISILIVEQNVRSVLGLTDRVYVINKGSIQFTGKTQDLLAHEDIMKNYLGI